MHDATMLTQGGIKVDAIRNIESENEVDVVVAVGELEVALRNLGAIGSDVDFDEFAVKFVAEVVGFLLVECNDEILEGVGVGFEGVFGLEKLKGIGSGAGVDGGGMFAESVKHKAEGDGGGHLVDGWVIAERDENIFGRINTIDYLVDGAVPFRRGGRFWGFSIGGHLYFDL